MKSKIHIFLKYMFLWALGGSIYYVVELCWRGFSHWSMFILGGICFIFAGRQNENTEWEEPIWQQILKVDVFVMLGEFFTGCIVNILLELNVWDYTNLPFNILGQTCLQFAILFLPLCLVAIVLDDYVRYWIFKEEKPHYHLLHRRERCE